MGRSAPIIVIYSYIHIIKLNSPIKKVFGLEAFVVDYRCDIVRKLSY